MARGIRFAAATAAALLAIAGTAAAGEGDLERDVEATKKRVEEIRRRIDALDAGRRPPGRDPAPDDAAVGRAVDDWFTRHPRADAGGGNVRAPGVRSLTFSGQILVWGEHYEGMYRSTDGTGAKDQDVEWLRASLQVDADIAEGLAARIEVRDARAFGQEPATNSQVQTNGVGLDLKQGWLEVGDLFRTKTTARAGRMVLSYGDQRLVGDLDWTTYGRSFDGVLLSRVFGRTKVDAFGTRVTERGLGTVAPGADTGDREFYGVYATTPKALHHSDLDVYGFYVRDLLESPGALPGTAGNTGFWTGGARVAGVRGSLDWGFEGAAQGGRVNGDRLRAWAGHARAGWTFPKAPWMPRIGGEYDRASGDDDPADGDVGTFQGLFPEYHSHFGLYDVMAWQNMQAAAVSLRLQPTSTWTVDLAAWKLWLAEETDAWYGANGGVIRPGAAGASKSLGTEIDAAATWKASDHLRVTVGAAQFLDGPFVRDTGGGGDAFWCYLRVQVDF